MRFGVGKPNGHTLEEISHVFGLTHCDDYECVMAASHSVEWMDLKRVGI